MNSVRLYYISQQGDNNLAKLDKELVDQWFSELSAQKQASIQRLINESDRITSLLGLRLLKMCAQDECLDDFNLAGIEYPETGKPFWDNKDFFDFNISHSGEMILAAVSQSLNVGVDVEKIRELKRLNFKMVMRDEELAQIHKTPDVFFNLWSKKEAVVKAANTGGIARMRDVKIINDLAILDKKEWHLKNIDLDDQFSIHLATSLPVDKLIINQIAIGNLSE